MKLYAIRDRLLEYFQRPFIGDSDATVLAAVASAINTETKVDFAQTPTHFEIWVLADIEEETGKVTPTPRFIANCSDLRRGVRENGNSGTPKSAWPAPEGPNGPAGSPSHADTTDRPPQGTVESQTHPSG